LKVKCDEPLSKFAFNFNLRRYNLDDATVPHFCQLVHPKLLYQLNLTGQAALIEGLKEIKMQEEDLSFLSEEYKVGRCRLTVSNPELKARLVSALETKM
jgi:hypothetical protein